MSKYYGLIIIVMLLMTGLTGLILDTTAPEPPQAVIAVKTIQQPPAEYEALATELNQTRQQHELPALTYNAKLQASACYKADEVLSNNNWQHLNADGTETWVYFAKAGYEYTKAAENLAKGYSTNTAMIQAWLYSPSHRANLLSDKYTEHGLCVKTGELDSKTTSVTVHHFGRSNKV